MILLLVPLVGLLVVVGHNFGWRWVLAPLLAYALLTWSLSSFRALASSRRAADDEDEAGPVGPDERTFFWCEECGTELLLLVRGTARGPTHCGQRMHERTELPN